MWPLVASVAKRPVVLAIGRAQHADGAGVGACLILEEADLGEFRIGMGHGRYGVMVETDRAGGTARAGPRAPA